MRDECCGYRGTGRFEKEADFFMETGGVLEAGLATHSGERAVGPGSIVLFHKTVLTSWGVMRIIKSLGGYLANSKHSRNTGQMNE